MPVFSYKARDRKGALVTGTLEGNDRSAVEASLDRMSLIPIAVSLSSAKGTTQLSFTRINTLFQKIGDQDLIIFSRQLATLFGAGIPLTKALVTLERQMTNPKFVDVIRSIRVDVEGGSTFAAAIGKHPKVFGELYTGMVEAGEAGGILEEILDRLAFMLEKSSENRAKVKSATLYPKIVVGAIVVAVVFLLWFVVPKFAQLYGSFNVSLPLPTRMLIGLSNAVLSYWYIGV
ncbi:MAG: type II secretion system F family protein, partial [Thermodesulfobacteriota bacterium]